MPAARYAPAGRDGIHIISHANEASAYRICAANISHGASRISQKGFVVWKKKQQKKETN